MKNIESIESKIFEATRIIGVNTTENRNSNNVFNIMTFEGSLLDIGYVPTPDSIRVLLYTSDDYQDIYDKMVNYIGKIEAKPMYPNYPSELIGMTECRYRLDQFLHYASAYNYRTLSGIFGNENINFDVYRPDAADTEKKYSDETILAAKNFEIVSYDKYYYMVFEHILSKRERMNNSEKEIIEFILTKLDMDDIGHIDFDIKFKENMSDIITYVMNADIDNKIKSYIIHNICQHSGDLIKAIVDYLVNNKLRIKNSQKKVFCRALDMFDEKDFKCNIMRSNTERETVLFVLKSIDFSTYTRNISHKKAVYDLRNKKLRSWYSLVEEAIQNDDKEEVLQLFSSRPTELLRNLNRLYNLNFRYDILNRVLATVSYKIPMNTLVSVSNVFAYKAITEKEDRVKCIELNKILLNALREKCKHLNLSFAGKKVYIDDSDFNMDESVVIPNNNVENSYIRPGIAYNIPEDTNIIRFFCYWNDSNDYTDMDLHAYGIKSLDEELNFDRVSLLNNDNSNIVHIGWNGEFMSDGIVTSGDLTTPDSAEYIDIDLRVPSFDTVITTVDSYSGSTFKYIDTVFTGALAVNKLDDNVKLYDPKNCFWYNYLNSDNRYLTYAAIQLKQKCITLLADPSSDVADVINHHTSCMPLDLYLNTILEGQCCKVVDTRDDADVVIVLGKPKNDKEVSLTENNLFFDL